MKLFSKFPFAPDNEKQIDPRKTSTKETYFKYNLVQNQISSTNNNLQEHSRSLKNDPGYRRVISKEKRTLRGSKHTCNHGQKSFWK